MNSSKFLSYLGNKWSTKTYFIEYKSFLSNHLLHGLVALHGIGATMNRLDRFVESYSTKLEGPEQDKDTHPIEDFDTYSIGSKTNYYGLVNFFEAKIQQNGMHQTIQNYFPRFQGGICGSAFHGIIHLGFAYHAKLDRGVAEGLAYLAYTYVHFSPYASEPTTPASKLDLDLPSLVALLNNIRNEGKLTQLMQENLPETYGYQTQMKTQSKVSQNEISSLVSMLNIPQWDESYGLTDLCLQLYLSNSLKSEKTEFFLLHGVTAAWSLENLLHLFSPEMQQEMIAHFLCAAIANFVARGCPDVQLDDGYFESEAQGKLLDWDDLQIQALSDYEADEHVYKLVFVGKDMAMRKPEHDGFYKMAAKETLEKKLNIY